MKILVTGGAGQLGEALMRGVDAVLHVATLHKPHVATHSKQAFIDANLTGTPNCSKKPQPRRSALSCSPAPPAVSATRWHRRPMHRPCGSTKT